MPGSSMIGNLAVTLGLNTAAFERGATKAEVRARQLQGRLAGVGSSIKGFGAALGIGLGVTAIVGFTKNAFDMASALDESAQKMGVSVEALQELNLAAEQSGISQESLSGALRKMNKALGELAQGSKPATEAFAKLGLAAEDFKGKSPEQSLRIIADALNKLPSVQERVAIGSQIMGRSFSELLPLINQGSAGLDKYAETSRKNGQITTEEAKRLDDLADAWERLKVRVGVATAKVIAAMAEFVSKSDAFTTNWYTWRDNTIAAAEAMASGAVRAVENMVSGIARAITGRLSAIWEGAKAKIESVKQKFQEMYDAVVGHSYVPDMVQGIAMSFAQLGRIMVDPTVSATDKVAAAFSGLRDVIGQILGSKTGGIFNMIMGFVDVLGPLIGQVFGGRPITGITGASAPIGGGSAIGSPITFAAKGASGTFGGFGGIDKNVLSMNGSPIMRVSKGEQFSVSPNSNSRVIVELRDDMLDARIADGADVQIVRRYPALQAGVRKAEFERRRRS